MVATPFPKQKPPFNSTETVERSLFCGLREVVCFCRCLRLLTLFQTPGSETTRGRKSHTNRTRNKRASWRLISKRCLQLIPLCRGPGCSLNAAAASFHARKTVSSAWSLLRGLRILQATLSLAAPRRERPTARGLLKRQGAGATEHFLPVQLWYRVLSANLAEPTGINANAFLQREILVITL